MRALLFFAACFLLGISCKSNKINTGNDDVIYFINKGFELKKNENALDSQLGNITYGNTVLFYDLGPYSYTGPLTDKEKFRKEFDNYHHRKFFEMTKIDPKVAKLFLDSVNVIAVEEKKSDEGLMFDCTPCNAVSKLKFKGKTFDYPFTRKDKTNGQDDIRYIIHIEDGITYKVYKERDQYPGLYATPSENRFSKKKTLSVTVQKTDLDDEKIIDLLKNIRIKEVFAFTE